MVQVLCIYDRKCRGMEVGVDDGESVKNLHNEWSRNMEKVKIKPAGVEWAHKNLHGNGAVY